MNAHSTLWKPQAWKVAWLVLVSPAAMGQGELVFVQPKNGAVFKAGAEVPVQLTAYAPDDVFPSGELFANNALLAPLNFCCWLCPCAYPITGITTTLQIPGPHELDRPGLKPWQGWRFPVPGTYVLTAKAHGENGTVIQALPITITIEAINLRLGVQVSPDGLVNLVLPEGSLFPEPIAVELSRDLKNWVRLGFFEPGNVAAFYQDRPDPKDTGPRYYRAVLAGQRF